MEGGSLKKPKLKILLLTGLDDAWIAELVSRLKALPEVEFSRVILWRRAVPAAARIRKNIRKHGLWYVPWRLTRLVADAAVRPLKDLFRSFLLAPSKEPDLASACSVLGITVHRTEDAHAPGMIELVRSLRCDLLLLCGTGIIREPLISLPRLGAINLHQGEVPRYRGAPPGFWELWNGERHAGVTIHFVDSGVDTGDIVLQRLVPIFGEDDHGRLRGRLAEVSLQLYPEAVSRIAQGTFDRTKQSSTAGTTYTFPTLRQTLQLWSRRAASRHNPLRLARSAAKKLLFLLVLPVISLRDKMLLLAGHDILSVLYYHRVTDLCRDGMTIGRAAFEEQLRFLKKRYPILAPSQLPAWLGRERKGRGEKAVLLTFDDGYEDNYRNALPLLERHACPALFFVSTAHINNDRAFEHDRRMQPRLRFKTMTWDQVREMERRGMSVGVHSHDHCDLGGMTHAEAVRQVELSISVFTEELGHRPAFMSYPFGGRKQVTRELADHVRRATGLSALFCAYGNKNISPVDPYCINRENVGANDDDLLIFRYKTEGGLRTLFRPVERPWPAPGPHLPLERQS